MIRVTNRGKGWQGEGGGVAWLGKGLDRTRTGEKEVDIDKVMGTMESASTPISAGGWRYDPGNEQDRSDFAGYTAEELRNLAREDDRGYDFSQHPAVIAG